jgi:ABC-type antimicrobial peptide transport system permease subunit
MEVKNSKPPLLAKIILSWFLNHRHPETMLGDFEEIYNDHIINKGIFYAKSWYWFQLITTFPSFVNNTFYWFFILFSNYVKVSYRILLKQKIFSFINVFGLSIGMACTILILLWVHDELSRDTFHENVENLYKVYQKFSYSDNQTFYTDNSCGPLAAELKSKFPFIKYSARLLPAGYFTVGFKNKIFDEIVCMTDQSLFEMFTFEFTKGEMENALVDPSSIVIAEKLVYKYFGNLNPIGKMITINNKYDFKVTGIIKNIPENSHLNYISFLVPFSQTNNLVGDTFKSWGRNWPKTYVLLENEASKKKVEQQIKNIVKEHIPSSTSSCNLQSIKEIGLYNYEGNPEGIINIYVFSAVAFVILVIACINYTNLSLAQAHIRSKEIGIRRTIGANHRNIFSQFFGESILYSFIAFIFAIVIIIVLLPIFNDITNKNIKFSFLNNYNFIIMVFIVISISSIISGIFPAVFLSSIDPLKILSGTFRKRNKTNYFQNTLIVFQYSISIILFISTIIIYQQMQYMIRSNLGYDKENIMFVSLDIESKKQYDVLKNELLKDPKILNVTRATNLPIYGGDSTPDNDWEGKDPDLSVLLNRIYVDNNYIEFYNIKLVEGKGFQANNNGLEQKTKEIILNETAINRMQIKNPINKKFTTGGIEYKIVGIAQDFHFASFYNEIEPLAICSNHDVANIVLIKLNDQKLDLALNSIQSTWQNINKLSSFNYGFLEIEITNLYLSEEKMGNILKYFTFLSLLIASLGLFGMSELISNQRVKEIGIHKVMGASITKITTILSKKFIYIVFVSCIISWPLTWYLMDNWLQNFSYKININLWIFFLSSLIVILIAIITVLSKTIKIAIKNPVESLRYE